jgi:hypothetical protein
MLSVVMLNVSMLSVVAPSNSPSFFAELLSKLFMADRIWKKWQNYSKNYNLKHPAKF